MYFRARLTALVRTEYDLIAKSDQICLGIPELDPALRVGTRFLGTKETDLLESSYPHGSDLLNYKPGHIS